MSDILDIVSPIDLNLDYGEGNYLFDKQGNAYLDTFSGIAVNALGYNHPKLQKALTHQANKYYHVSNFFRTDSQEQLASYLIQHSNASKVFFANSGTEANEAALKLVRKYGRSVDKNKTAILTVQSAFHGRTVGSMALSGDATKYQNFDPKLPGIEHVRRNDINHLNELVNDNVCAIFLELIHGSSGIHVLDEEFLEAVMETSKKHHMLIVVDEVQTGLMRTGTMFYYQQTALIPDIITLAKSLGGGLPLGAMLVREPYINVLKPGDHGSTFGGNPLSCALGVALMDTITNELFNAMYQENLIYFDEALRRLQAFYPSIIKAIRGTGYMRGMEVHIDAKELQEKALKDNLLLNITAGNVIRLLPALIFEKKEIDCFESKLSKLFKAY